MNNNKISLLIVDDEQDLLELYQEVFEVEGFKVFTASNASEGLEIYQKNSGINIIISDSTMAKVSGADFLKKLKSLYPVIPNFYLATGSVEQTEQEVKSMGAKGLIFKPFDVDEIIVRIKKDLKV